MEVAIHVLKAIEISKRVKIGAEEADCWASSSGRDDHGLVKWSQRNQRSRMEEVTNTKTEGSGLGKEVSKAKY